jgi:hypothetical protein
MRTIGTLEWPTQRWPAFDRLQHARRRSLIFAGDYWRPIALLIISATLALFYLIGRPYILYNDSDPLTYFTKAWWLLGRPIGMDIPWRGPGYPLWLIITGAASIDTWWVLISSQVAMAIAAPVLVYGMLSPMSRNAAFAAGLLFIIFAVPYHHMNWVMVEELFLFVELLAFLLIQRYLCGSWAILPPPHDCDLQMRLTYWLRTWVSTPYPIAILLLYDTLIKPAAAPFFWIFIGTCLVFRVEPWRRYVGPVVLYAAIMTAWGVYCYYYSPVRFPTLAAVATKAERTFADAYFRDFSGALGEGFPAIRPDDGPASQQLYNTTAKAIAAAKARGQWNVSGPITTEQLFGRFSNDGLLQEIFARPNPLYFNFVVQAAAANGDEEILNEVAREHGTAGVPGLIRFLINHPLTPLIGTGNSYVGFMFISKYYSYRDYRADNKFGMRDLFVSSWQENLIDPEAGKATKVFVDSIRYFISTFPEFIDIGNQVLEEFGGRDRFIDYVITDPYHTKYAGSLMAWIFQWLAMLHGEEKMGAIMARAATEITMHNSSALKILFGDLLGAMCYGRFASSLHFLARPPVWVSIDSLFHPKNYLATLRKGLEPWLRSVVESGRNNDELPEGLKQGVGDYGGPRSEMAQNISAILEIQYGAFQVAKPIKFALMLMFSIALIVLGPGGRFVAFLVVCFFVSAAAAGAIVFIMPFGDPRHEDVYAFIPLLISVLGVAQLPKFFKAAVQNSAAG